jgi:hydroxymethylpyrimidine/phosphomethylpyrimidine kinase
MSTPVALTIAGSDPSGGAGLQADLKTFHQFGVYGMAVVTLLTVQNTREVSAVVPIDPDLVRRQIEAAVSDIPPNAAKIGALGSAGIIAVVAECAASFPFPLVVDPVMISKHGASLMAEEARDTLCRLILPHTFLLTPNTLEAEALTGMPVRTVDDLQPAAERIASMGPRAVLLKGGHLPGEPLDLLFMEGRTRVYPSRRIDTPHTHGTGCTYSAAITAELARGTSLEEAVAAAKTFITRAIESNPALGGGCGPVNHHAPPR